MRIHVNGEPREVSARTVAELLVELRGPDAPREGVAVAVDGEVIPRADHVTHPLREGARVELIRAVGGG
jgi:sulfur carrier protein